MCGESGAPGIPNHDELRDSATLSRWQTRSWVLRALFVFVGLVSLSRVFFFIAVTCGVALVPIIASAKQYRSREVTREFQREHPCPSTGKTSGACPGYRKDHIRPLACGGADAVWNLQWQTIADARAKDAWERGLAVVRPGAPPYCRVYTGGTTDLREIVWPEILDAGASV